MHSLRHKPEFEQVLSDYHVSPQGQDVLSRAKLTLLVGLSASGRDTIISQLVEAGNFRYIASDTTRPPRINDDVHEQNGREYWFRTEEQFLADLRAGKLLEAEIIHDQQVSGISIREVEKCVQMQKVGITNVDLNIVHIVNADPNTRAILVLPPSFSVWMERLNNRGKMHKVEMIRRLKTAERILGQVDNWDFIDIVVNDTLPEAVAEVADISLGQRQDKKDRVTNHKIAKQLLLDVTRELSVVHV